MKRNIKKQIYISKDHADDFLNKYAYGENRDVSYDDCIVYLDYGDSRALFMDGCVYGLPKEEKAEEKTIQTRFKYNYKKV